MVKSRRPTILLANGNSTRRRSLARALAQEGYRVVACGNGEEALSFLKEKTPELMILDANLPLLGGIELCFRTKRVSKLREVPVVILAYGEDAEALRRAEASRAERVVPKPAAGEELTRVVHELLEPSSGRAA